MDVEAAMASLLGNSTKKKKKKKKHHHKRQRPKPPPTPKLKFTFPTERDVATFAQELGMDLEFDSEQQWLIDQALASELPPLWTRIFNPSGRSYYVREPTKQEPHEIITWIHPLMPAYSKIFDNILQEQLEAQKAALGIVSEDEEEDDEGETDIFVPNTPGGPKLSKSQRKKLRASLEDALLYYKSELGDPATEDVRPKEDVVGYWDCEPEDVEDMAIFLELDPVKESRLMWIARMACVAPLPPGWKAHGHGDDISVMCAENKSMNLNDIGELYSCHSWMCKTDAIIAKMALEMHPSHQYFDNLLQEARDEMGDLPEEDATDGGDGYDEEEFGDLDELILCEFRNEMGNIYIYDYKNGEITRTDRVVKDEDDKEEENDEAGEEKKKEEEIVEKESSKIILQPKQSRTTTPEQNTAPLSKPEQDNTSNHATLFTNDALLHIFSEFDDDSSGSITSNEFHLAFQRLGLSKHELNFDVETFIHKMDEDGDGTVNFDEFKLHIRRLTDSTMPSSSSHHNKDNQKENDDDGPITIIDDSGTVVAVPKPPRPTPAIALALQLSNATFGDDHSKEQITISNTQIIDFATHIGLNIHDRNEEKFHYLIIDCFESIDNRKAIGIGWIYRIDPNGNHHYYKNIQDDVSDLIGTQNSAVSSGWGQEDEIQNQYENLKIQKNIQKDRLLNPLIQSSWKHPSVKKYKKKYKIEKAQYMEDVRIQRVKGLREKSTQIHLNKMATAQKVGGQHIILFGTDGQELSLSSPLRRGSIQKPKQAEMKHNLINPSTRKIPLQPGFSDAQKNKLKRELLEKMSQHGSQNEHEATSPLNSGRAVSRAVSPIQDLLRQRNVNDDEAPTSSSLNNNNNTMHRAFRSCNLSDTAGEKREREEQRRQERRKKRIDPSKKKRNLIKQQLNERTKLAKSKSSPSFPPLQLDATAKLGVVSLTKLQQKKQQKYARQQQRKQQSNHQRNNFIRDDQNNFSSSDDEGNEGNYYDTYEETVGYSLPSPKMKGILSPSHQGRFAAVGNLVPISSEKWDAIHIENDLLVEQQKNGYWKSNIEMEEEEIEQMKLNQYQLNYDNELKEENNIIDEWLLKKRYDSGDEKGDEDGKEGGTQGDHGNGPKMTVSFSVGEVNINVSKAINIASNLFPSIDQ